MAHGLSLKLRNIVVRPITIWKSYSRWTGRKSQGTRTVDATRARNAAKITTRRDARARAIANGLGRRGTQS